ncbi:MAG TPA: hypothetical protein DGF30_02815 [Desulfomicrobium sp.]|nr:hypothetical protein [Desulfomicrobium sp.]
MPNIEGLRVAFMQSERDEWPRVESALTVIDAADREAWTRCGMAIKAEFGEDGFSLWDGWSRTADNYDERDARDVWRSFGESGAVGLGSLFHLAKESGWSNGAPTRALSPEEVEARRRSREEAARRDAEALAMEGRQAREWAASLVSAAQPARADHPYLVRKQVRRASTMLEIPAPEAAQILGYTPTARGQELTGRLLVIPQERVGEAGPCTVEFIDENGCKATLKGRGTKSGAFGRLSAPQDAPEVVLVGEGAATVLSALEALQERKPAGFMTSCNSNMSGVAQALRGRHPQAKIIILADLDKQTGEPDQHAVKAAQLVDGVLAAPGFGPNRNPEQTDFNDLQAAKGLEAVRACLEAAASGPVRPRFRILRRDDLMVLPDLEWIVKGVMPTRGVGAVHGPSTVGKSFLLVDMAAHIAEGRPWFGHRVKARQVAYIALEGQFGFKRRVQAWEQHHGRRYPSGVAFIPDPVDVRSDADTAALSAVLQREFKPGAVVIVDTLNRAAPGMEENSSRDYGLVLAGAKRIEDAAQGFVCFSAHPGKDASKGLRGHYSMFAGLDMNLELAPDQTDKTLFSWTVRKVKDGPDGASKHFRRVEVELFEDEDGDQVTSCVIVPDLQADKVPGASRRPMTKKEAECFEAFRHAAMEYGATDAAGNFIGLHVEEWRRHFYKTSSAPTQDAKRTAFNKAKGALTRGGWLFENVDGMLRPDGPGSDVHEHNISEAIRERTGRTEPNQDRTGSGAEYPHRRTEPNHPPLGGVRFGSLGSAETTGSNKGSEPAEVEL